MSSRDVAATRLVMAVDGLDALAATLRDAAMDFVSPGIVMLRDASRAALVRDPDGHAVTLIQPAGAGDVPAKGAT